MRILYVTSYYKPAYVYGGPVRSISQMCEALVRLGAQVTVITTNANGAHTLNVPLGQPTNVDSVQVFYYPVVRIPPRSFFYSPTQVRACVDQILRSDIVVIETLWTHPIRAVADCRRAHVPYIISLRGQLLSWALAHKALKKKFYLALFARQYLNDAAALHCTDPVEAEAIPQLHLRAPTFVVPNGLEVSRYAHLPERGQLRRELGISSTAHVLLLLGRLSLKKQPEIAVTTLAATLSSQPDTHLIVAGPDEANLTHSLGVQAKELNCLERVHFLGLLSSDQVLTVFADSDMLLMPSAPHSENFGMSALEAMAAGVPIIVSEGVPVGRWAEQAGAGMKIAATADAFARATCELLADPEQLRMMGALGQELVRERFDLPIVARQMLAQCEAIVKTGEPLSEIVPPDLLLQTSTS